MTRRLYLVDYLHEATKHCLLSTGTHDKNSSPVKAIFDRMRDNKRRRWMDDIKEWTKLGWNELNMKVKDVTEYNGFVMVKPLIKRQD